jgi:hypothetical protein
MSHFDRELDLSRAAVQLRATSPTAWDEFLQSLAAYSGSVTERCISSPLDALPNAQGRAQAVALLSQLLKDAPATVERMTHRGR